MTADPELVKLITDAVVKLLCPADDDIIDAVTDALAPHVVMRRQYDELLVKHTELAETSLDLAESALRDGKAAEDRAAELQNAYAAAMEQNESLGHGLRLEEMRVAELEAALTAGIEAMRLTREYVGEDLLPPKPGWSWFDWTEKARALLAASEGTQP